MNFVYKSLIIAMLAVSTSFAGDNATPAASPANPASQNSVPLTNEDTAKIIKAFEIVAGAQLETVAKANKDLEFITANFCVVLIDGLPYVFRTTDVTNPLCKKLPINPVLALDPYQVKFFCALFAASRG
ncbi:MAG: hypothetical protein LBE97_00110 [Holosporales bacterium]|jgi:hypothetical protein|nr:hypothetical protein [Holosporales bacterium]